MRRSLFAAIAIAIVIATSVVFRVDIASAAKDLIQDVFVTNDAKHPVPVEVIRGTVEVGRPQAATISWFSWAEGVPGGGGGQCRAASGAVLVSTIVLTAERGPAKFEMRSVPDCSSGGGTVTFEAEVAADSSVAIPISERVVVNDVSVRCVLACRGAWTLIGRPAAP